MRSRISFQLALLFYSQLQNVLFNTQPFLLVVASKPKDCSMQDLENCFNELFDNMPICSSSPFMFTCKHFKILDECFTKSSMVCPPTTLGQIATTTHRRKLISCARQTSKQYRNAPNRRKSAAPAILRNQPPTELQFISLFGFLQSQCNVKLVANCTNQDYHSMISTCENDIKRKTLLTNMDYDRSKLLIRKLDTSSQLMQIPETSRENECLIVRAALSDIYKIHQNYCFHTVVTRCMCERMNFEYFCDIECASLDASGLPLDKRLSWANFKGQLVGGALSTSLPLFTFIGCFITIVFRPS
uniref:GDNF domain-containing protein n=1 Tax=Panagrellus redivivus TaxID=6233 RepID=A0A7E4ZWQ4_PANRE